MATNIEVVSSCPEQMDLDQYSETQFAQQAASDLQDGESALIAACCQNDRNAQQQLYEKYSPQVFGLMCRMVG